MRTRLMLLECERCHQAIGYCEVFECKPDNVHVPDVFCCNCAHDISDMVEFIGVQE